MKYAKTSPREMSGPTIYAKVMDNRTDNLIRRSETVIGSVTDRCRFELRKLYEEEIRRAYIAGVADGFAQGVAAAEDQEPPPT